MLEYHNNQGGIMSFDRKTQQLRDQEIESMTIAVNEVGISAIHPDKLQDFAEAMVRKLREQHNS